MYSERSKRGSMTRKFIECSKCSIKLEAPPAAQAIFCSNCNTYNTNTQPRPRPQPQPQPQPQPAKTRGDHVLINYNQMTATPSAGSQAQQTITVNKRAILCGVSYKGFKYRLKGTVNDVLKMEKFLTQRFNFPQHSIRILTEDQPKPENTPTKKNIEDALKWLVEGCRSGDSLVFYYSGHGLRQPDFVGDEKDGFDETICPVDFRKEGMIFDDHINSIIVKPLPTGVKLHAIVDACHSGTILDLHYTYNRKLKKWEADVPPSGRPPKGTNGGLAICFSACEDGQKAMDTTAFSEKGKHCFSRKEMNGAMTTLFLQAFENESSITYAEILDFIDDNISRINTKRGCLKRPSIRRMFSSGILQEAQLSASMEFNVNAEFKL